MSNQNPKILRAATILDMNIIIDYVYKALDLLRDEGTLLEEDNELMGSLEKLKRASCASVRERAFHMVWQGSGAGIFGEDLTSQFSRDTVIAIFNGNHFGDDERLAALALSVSA